MNLLKAGANETPAPGLPPMFSRYKDALEAELRQCLGFPPVAVAEGDDSDAVYRVLHYHMGWADSRGDPLDTPVSPGKALRPTLCLFACEALGQDWTRALPLAAALEITHNFSLIHDDIQDGDLERRHRPTVWSIWGRPQALVAGNAMRSLADVAALSIDAGLAPDRALRASLVLTRGYLDMTRGQCLDLAFEGRLDITIEDYLGMVACKTGALIRCGIEMGALAASDDQVRVEAFARCGAALGLAFQIRDDFLGIWGDEAATGKAVGNDIWRKKKSFPIVCALEVATDASCQKLLDIYGKETLEQADVDQVLDVLGELGVAQRAQEVTREKADLALRRAALVPMPAWARAEVQDLVEFTAERRY